MALLFVDRVIIFVLSTKHKSNKYKGHSWMLCAVHWKFGHENNGSRTRTKERKNVEGKNYKRSLPTLIGSIDNVMCSADRIFPWKWVKTSRFEKLHSRAIFVTSFLNWETPSFVQNQSLINNHQKVRFMKIQALEKKFGFDFLHFDQDQEQFFHP